MGRQQHHKEMCKTLALVAVFISASMAFPTSLPASVFGTRGALFFAEQRAGRVGYIGWPPIGCKTDTDCKAVNGSYCANDPTKTAPFFCHEGPVFITSGLDKPVGIGMDTNSMQVFYTEDDQ